MLDYVLNSSGDAYIVMSERDRSIEKAVIPDTYNGLPITEVKASFEGFDNLKEIIIGNNVTKTAYGTFNCEKLERIYLGRSVVSVSGPFAECKNLSGIYFSGSKEQFENIDIVMVDDSNAIFTNTPVHYGILGKSGVLTLGEETFFPYTHWDCVKNKPEKISAEKVSYNNSVSGLNADNVRAAIDELNARSFDSSSLESWEELKYLVRSGRAADLIKTGDKFVCRKNNEELVWDVIGIDVDTPVNKEFTHSLTLQLSDCYINFPYSVPDASYFATTSLSAGQYYIGLKSYTSPTVYYAFTLDEKLEMDSFIRISEGVVYLYNSRNSDPYHSFNVDFSSVDESEMTGKKLSDTTYGIKSSMGSTSYKDSVIRQWINSAEKDWWISLSMVSLAPPADYLNMPGFLNGMDEDFLDAVNPVIKKTRLPDGKEIETSDKFFLLSSEEVYASGTEHYPYYKENSIWPEPGIAADAIRIKNLEDSPRHWWLRNPADGDDGYIRVLTDGGVGFVKAAKVLTYGVSPACCIC